MGNFKDLTGMKFGKWTVIERSADTFHFDNKRGKEKPCTMWLCKCECGVYKSVSGGSLKRGRSKGCSECVKPTNYKDLTGKRFERLTVIREEGRNNKGEVLWLCECDCGNTSIVLTSNLNRGNTMSCGCLNKELQQKRCEQLRLEREERNAKERAEKKLNKFVDKFNNVYQGKFNYIYGYEDIENNIIVVQCTICNKTHKVNRKKMLSNRFVCECGNNQRTYYCEECGKEFVQRTSLQVLCGECHNKKDREKKKVKQKTYKRIREAKALKNGKVDYSVTLSKLIERDNHICQLCGRMVDETDYTYINDTFIAGNNYPSIDHIKPLSKGGVHQWDNVQLAHRLCNSLKCDKEC